MSDPQFFQNQGSGDGAAQAPVSAAPVTGGAGSTGASMDRDQAVAQINRELQEKGTAEKARQRGLPYVNLSAFPVNPDVLHVLVPEQAREAGVFPFYKVGMRVRIAVSDPDNLKTQEVIAALKNSGHEVEINMASSAAIAEKMSLYDSQQYKPREELKATIDEGKDRAAEQELVSLRELQKQIETVPSEEGLMLLHVGAVKAGASDIHYQPGEKGTEVRFRIDGVLHSVFQLSAEVYAKLANQLKYKAKMKLNITNVPQDGRFHFVVNDRQIDVRIASLPTQFGETFSCRLLDAGKKFFTFAELGFSGAPLEVLQRASSMVQGMVLITGPTGSGKTTTLYSLLREFNTPEKKIITLEDPIEYHVDGIVQSQVNEKRGYTFGGGLRSILRHDPDVVMLGEIRDLETAEAAAQAALTGHVLLSTLHTKSALGAIPRLAIIGLPNFMIAPTLNTVIAQRLVRRVCQNCKEMQALAAQDKQYLENALQNIKLVSPTVNAVVPQTVPVGKGCDSCSGTGYKGQLVVAEALNVDAELRGLVLAGAPESELWNNARRRGFLTLTEDGLLKVMGGLTTLAEVYRVTSGVG